MDRAEVVELVPHYVAMVALALLVLGALRVTVGDLGLAVEFVVIAVVVFSYRPLVRRLGLAPALWTR